MIVHVATILYTHLLISTEWFTPSGHMEKLDNTVLHLVMYLSTKAGISFQTARAFAIILAASLLVTYLDAASDCEQN